MSIVQEPEPEDGFVSKLSSSLNKLAGAAIGKDSKLFKLNLAPPRRISYQIKLQKHH